MFQQVGQIHQVNDTKEGAPLSQGNLQIRTSKIGPLRRNRANRSLAELQQKPLTGARVALPDAEELLSPKGVERMRDPHKICRYGGRACISR